jgi:hypothetical protein
MVVAVPIVIAVGLFLGWCLVKPIAHALPLFAGLPTVSLLLHIGASVGVSLAAGALDGHAVRRRGRIAGRRIARRDGARRRHRPVRGAGMFYRLSCRDGSDRHRPAI